MRSGGWLTRDGLILGGLIGLVGVVVLIVEGALALADHVLGTRGDVLVWIGLGLVAVGAALVVIALVQEPQAVADEDAAAISSDG